MASKALLILLLSASLAGDEETLLLAESIPLPQVEGRFDHFAVDLKSKRLFVAALGNDTVEQISLGAGPREAKSSGRIPGLREPQGVLVLPETKEVAVASGKDGTLRVYRGESLELTHTIEVGEDADNVRFDAAANRVYVGCQRTLVVVDSAKWKKVADIPLQGHAESFQLEKSGKRIFVNVPDAKHVAVVDREKRVVFAKWSLEGAEANFPMALDEAHRRLLVGCRKPAKIVVLDIDSGKQVVSLECSGDMDDLFYDASSRKIYASCGEGFIDVFEQGDADRYRRISRVATFPGARTSLWVAEQETLYLAVPHRGDQKAMICIYRNR